MNNQITPFYFENKPVRTVVIDSNIWFVAADVCKAIDISHSASAIRVLDTDERGMHLMHTPSGQQNMSVVSESGLYTLILRCRDAVKQGTVPHRFRKWVTNEVLPQIRKTGSYQHPQHQPKEAYIAEFNHMEAKLYATASDEAVRVTIPSEGRWLVCYKNRQHQITNIDGNNCVSVEYIHKLRRDVSMLIQVLQSFSCRTMVMSGDTSPTCLNKPLIEKQ